MDALHLLAPAPPERVVEIGTLAPGTPFMFVRQDGRLGVAVDYIDLDQEQWGSTDTHTWYSCERERMSGGGGTLKSTRVIAIHPDEIPALKAEYEARREEWQNAPLVLVPQADGRWQLTLGV